MNLHAIVSGAVGAINPFTPATLTRISGFTTESDGTKVPAAMQTMQMLVQVQSLSNDELKQLEGLNIQGNKAAVYLNGQWGGIVRVGARGGDLLQFNGQTWLAVTVLESWSDWTKLAVVLQNGS